MFKRILFAPFVIISLLPALYQMSLFLKSPYSFISLDIEPLVSLLILTGSLLLTGFFFTVFSSLAQDWRYILPVSILASAPAFYYIQPPLVYYLVGGMVLAFWLIFALINSTMQTYLTFSPTTLLTPYVKNLARLFLIAFSIIYFTSVFQAIGQNGFIVPDQILDTAMKLVPNTGNQKLDLNQLGNSQNLGLPSISPDQVQYYKQHPEILKQHGISPQILDLITPTNSGVSSLPDSANSLIKNQLKNQIQSYVKPYEAYIPVLLTALFFLTVYSFISLVGIFVTPIIFLFYLILEKTNFIHFDTEMREVKKLVV